MSEATIVAIDGPSGVGKSTTSRRVASRLGIPHIDTGAMYRVVGLRALEAGVDREDEESVLALLERGEIRLGRVDGKARVYSGDEDVTDQIRTPEVGMAASDVSKLSGVRRRLVELQREIGRADGGVLEGRDIGTKVFPETPHKFFLTADPRVRAERRWKELKEKGSEVSLEEILKEQTTRDAQDRNRADSPLTYDETYRVVDTTEMTIEEVVDTIVELVEGRGQDSGSRN